MADFCEKLVIDAKNAYYKTDSPIMTDQVFDKLEEYLKILRPNSDVLKKVGC
jgi:NAD-dependent DNA ligase